MIIGAIRKKKKQSSVNFITDVSLSQHYDILSNTYSSLRPEWSSCKDLEHLALELKNEIEKLNLVYLENLLFIYRCLHTLTFCY